MRALGTLRTPVSGVEYVVAQDGRHLCAAGELTVTRCREWGSGFGFQRLVLQLLVSDTRCQRPAAGLRKIGVQTPKP